MLGNTARARARATTRLGSRFRAKVRTMGEGLEGRCEGRRAMGEGVRVRVRG